MANLKDVEEQLKRIGFNFRFWGRGEVKELVNVLLPGETIEHCVNGVYEGGFALLVATDQRMILIDKKPMYLTLEDIRFDMVSEVDFNHRLLNSALKVCTPNQTLFFKSYNGPSLRNLFNFVQKRVMEIRHYYMEQQTPHTTPQSQSSKFTNSAQPQAQPENAQQAITQLVSEEPSYSLRQPSIERFESQFTEQQSASDNELYPPQSQPPQQIQSSAAANAPQIVSSSSIQPGGGAPGQVNPQHIGVSGMKRVVPVISAYTRLPMLSRHRGYSSSTWK